MILFAIDEVVGRSHVEVWNVDAWGGVPDADEFVGLGIGERFEENAFQDAEDDGVAANASGQSDKGDGREERGVREATEDLLQVLQDCSHQRSLIGDCRGTCSWMAEPSMIETKRIRGSSVKFSAVRNNLAFGA